MAIYFAVVFGFYFLLLIVLWVGWKKTLISKTSAQSKRNFISVVIAMRNEKHNLQKLFQSLLTQNYTSAEFEIVLVDDHSTDDSLPEARKWIDRFDSLTILSLTENQRGKKAALAFGINQAKGEIIATTDADCVLPSHWLLRINEGFQNENTNMLIGAVALQNENKFFSQLQTIEFASVIGTGMALCLLGKPTMCSGANLSFRKKIFEEINGYVGNDHIASGDDEFLMRKIADKYPSTIEVLQPHESIVSTQSLQSVQNFIQQRLRWASKWKSNSSALARLLAVFMLTVQISWLGVIVWIFADKSPIAFAVLSLKLLIDFVFLSSISHQLKMKFHPLAFAFLQFLYPIYVLYIGIFSQTSNLHWKGRNI